MIVRMDSQIWKNYGDSHHKVMIKDYALDALLDPLCLGMPILKYYVLVKLVIWYHVIFLNSSKC